MLVLSSLLVLAIASVAYASPAAGPPTVKLDDATVVGFTDGPNTRFLGIPFAQPPTGRLRLRLPQPISRFTGTIDATKFGNQCIQQTITPVTLPKTFPAEAQAFLSAMGEPPDVPQSEDCLNINVIVPTGTRPGANLPVAAWIFGGGYQIGSNAVRPGEVIVNRSVEIGQPTIFVSMNYRLSAFGFLGGSEIQQQGLGNLGLHDQREALRWVQKHIAAFGGDPKRVTIWGESAGAQSVLFQMVNNGGNTEGLFRAGWMESGSALPTGNFQKLQPTFDFITSETGCANARDKVDCLRGVSADVIKTAMDKTATFLSFQALNTPWMPRADGVFLKNHPQLLVLQRSLANIPFVVGSNEDEGTLFSLANLNLTTTPEVAAYLSSNYFPAASKANITRLLELYPENPAAGSPFGTGNQFAFTPQYKRLASLQGDFIFQATRRFLLDNRHPGQSARSFLSERHKVAGLGATHTTELFNVFGGGDMTDLLVHFVNTLDPNPPRAAVRWPEYDARNPQLLGFVDGRAPLAVIPDNFRVAPMQFLQQLSLAQPL